MKELLELKGNEKVDMVTRFIHRLTQPRFYFFDSVRDYLENFNNVPRPKFSIRPPVREGYVFEIEGLTASTIESSGYYLDLIEVSQVDDRFIAEWNTDYLMTPVRRSLNDALINGSFKDREEGYVGRFVQLYDERLPKINFLLHPTDGVPRMRLRVSPPKRGGNAA